MAGSTRGRPFCVGLVAPPALEVPPIGYGGTERVVAALAAALERQNVDVRLASVGRVSGGFGKPVGLELPAPEASAADVLHVARSLRELEDVDVIHDHTKIAGTVMARFARAPVLTTIHNDANPARLQVFRQHPEHPFVFLSRAQAARFGASNPFGIVPNGLDLRPIALCRHKAGYLLFLGRLSKVKGPHEAIALAKILDLPLVLAGSIGPGDQRFFEDAIAPFVDGERIRFVGEVAGAAKWQLLGRAKALVAPFLWDEPFGLVLIEAMACGTPILGYDRGAAREIVADGRTGFLAADRGSLARAASRLEAIVPEDCRRHVAERFSSEAMAGSYLELYRQVRDHERKAVSWVGAR